ncbi:zinc/iron permease [Pyrodictium delaneyi]|uniref:ZIP family metal transporter n=1 Tax=Pyrodictium delaneyi TaxID=1273541 RepID=A0A0P0N3Z0_9CREN|nr:ZIP family metal transporter [Pyrodictium delaneyi]ALL01445.1 zinc/iron permease [Pyrodictium delaneyi]OWJ54640.1 ZIP family metal transporter [Pyrodictium delaneyi]
MAPPSLLGLQQLGPVEAALAMSLLAAVATTVGGLAALPLGGRRLDPRILDAGLGFSSGVMTVASFTSLLLPAIESAGQPWTPLLGFVAGAAVIAVVHRLLPHEHVLLDRYEGPEWGRRKLRAAWLVAVAILIHNLPEGMAIGAASAYSVEKGIATGLAIALQDVPEGLAVAMPVLLATGNMLAALGLSALSGLCEVATAVPTALLGEAAATHLPVILGFGAGAMVYVVSHEALPESHRSGHEDVATLGYFLGFIVMLILDTTI